jgi:hypothetical protein
MAEPKTWPCCAVEENLVPLRCQNRPSLRHHVKVNTIRLTSQGDVLILETEKPSTIYVVGCVRRSGQQDFQGQDPLTLRSFNSDRDAIAHAQTMVGPHGRIHLLNIDSWRWTEVTNTCQAHTSPAGNRQESTRGHR